MSTRLTIATNDWILIVILAVLWGGTFIFAKLALTDVPPITLALSRVAIASVVLLLVMQITGDKLPRRFALWGGLFLMAILNNVIPFGLIFWGQLHITAGLASILIATAPLFTAVIAHFATADEKVTSEKLIGIFFGLLGVLIMIGPSFIKDLGTQITAQLAVLAGGLFYGIAGIYGRRFRFEKPIPVATAQVMAATLILVPISALTDQPWGLHVPSAMAIGALLGLGIFSTGLGFVIFFRVLSRVGATNITVVNFLNPVVTVLVGTTLLSEPFTLREITGMGAIAIGLAAIDGRPVKYVRNLISQRA